MSHPKSLLRVFEMRRVSASYVNYNLISERKKCLGSNIPVNSASKSQIKAGSLAAFTHCTGKGTNAQDSPIFHSFGHYVTNVVNWDWVIS